MAETNCRILLLFVLWMATFFNKSSCQFQEHYFLGDDDSITLTDTDVRNAYRAGDRTPWWTFNTSVDRRIQFSFRRFYWYLYIGDGMSPGDNTRLVHFCRNYQPSDVVSISNAAWLKDYLVNFGSGFTVHYFTVDITSTPVPDAILLEEDIDFSITTPNYPNNYPKNAFQLWDMRVPEGLAVLVTVEHFNTYPNNGFLFFGDGVNKFSIGVDICNDWKKFSGVHEANSLEAELTPKASSFKIIFSSNCVQRTGFSIRMRAFRPQYRSTSSNTIHSRAPNITDCPTDITEHSNSRTTALMIWTPPTATSICRVVTLTSDYSPGDSFAIGTTSVTYTATDASGNTATCYFNATVVDSHAPIITDCPTDLIENSNSRTTFIITWTLPDATDNSGDLTLTSDYNPGDSFAIGTTRVTYTATDPSGNAATCLFNVTVVDTQVPIITDCPTNITENSNSGTTVIITWTPPTATDNSKVVTLTSDYNPGHSFAIGTTTVTYTATDQTGNTATYSFSVTVVDSQAPIITDCPTDITENCNSWTTVNITWTPPTGTDNSGMVTLTSNYSPGDSFAIGPTTVTYTATDESANTETCSFNVTVVDTQAPIIADCPTDITENSNSRITWTPSSATDNSGQVTLTSAYSPGDSFAIGTTTVSYTATDPSENTATCSFNVTVVDSQAPIITGCPADVIENSYFGTIVIITWPPPSATDNSGVLTLASDYSPGDSFDIGTTTVTYTATDPSEHTATCSFYITIVDRTDVGLTIRITIPSLSVATVLLLLVFIRWAHQKRRRHLENLDQRKYYEVTKTLPNAPLASGEGVGQRLFRDGLQTNPPGNDSDPDCTYYADSTYNIYDTIPDLDRQPQIAWTSEPIGTSFGDTVELSTFGKEAKEQYGYAPVPDPLAIQMQRKVKVAINANRPKEITQEKDKRMSGWRSSTNESTRYLEPNPQNPVSDLRSVRVFDEEGYLVPPTEERQRVKMVQKSSKASLNLAPCKIIDGTSRRPDEPDDLAHHAYEALDKTKVSSRKATSFTTSSLNHENTNEFECEPLQHTYHGCEIHDRDSLSIPRPVGSGVDDEGYIVPRRDRDIRATNQPFAPRGNDGGLSDPNGLCHTYHDMRDESSQNHQHSKRVTSAKTNPSAVKLPDCDMNESQVLQHTYHDMR